MNKTITLVFSFVFILIISLIVVLSTTGIKTEKFNNFITQKIKENNKKIELDLEAIQFKLDIKEASLFLETDRPKIYYRNVLIPSNKIKVYLDFLSIIKSEIKIKKVNLSLDLKKRKIQLICRFSARHLCLLLQLVLVGEVVVYLAWEAAAPVAG